MDSKACTLCKEIQVVGGNFSPAPSRVDGWAQWCNTCFAKKRRRLRAEARLATQLLNELVAATEDVILYTSIVKDIAARWKNRTEPT